MPGNSPHGVKRLDRSLLSSRGASSERGAGRVSRSSRVRRDAALWSGRPDRRPKRRRVSVAPGPEPRATGGALPDTPSAHRGDQRPVISCVALLRSPWRSDGSAASGRGGESRAPSLRTRLCALMADAGVGIACITWTTRDAGINEKRSTRPPLDHDVGEPGGHKRPAQIVDPLLRPCGVRIVARRVADTQTGHRDVRLLHATRFPRPSVTRIVTARTGRPRG
jgi:hypothetical protein